MKWLTAPQLSFIASEVQRALYPVVLEELNAGRLVQFGEVEVSRDGLIHKRNLIPWQDIDQVVFSHTVVVKKKDGSSCYIFNVINLDLFMSLAEARVSTGGFTAASPRQG